MNEREESAHRLREFIRQTKPGGCRVLSNADCKCPLCDVDTLAAAPQQAPAMAIYGTLTPTAQQAPAQPVIAHIQWSPGSEPSPELRATLQDMVMKAAASAQAAPSAPEGFVMVPREPTYAMVKAGSNECDPPRTAEAARVPIPDIYRAMIAAAPPASGQQEQQR